MLFSSKIKVKCLIGSVQTVFYGLRFRSNRFKHSVKRFGRFGLTTLLLIFNVLLVKSEHIWQSVDFERKRCQMNRKNDPIWLTMTWRFFKKTMKDSLRSLVGDFWPLSDAAWMMVLFLKSLFQSFNAQFVWNLFNINRMNESSKLYTATSFYADFTNFLS